MENKFYKYKDKLYEEPPFDRYVIKSTSTKEDGRVIYQIKKKRLSFLNLFLLLPLIGLIVFNIAIYDLRTGTGFTHITRVPEQMYYDSESGSIDVDIENDKQNVGSINIRLVDDVTNKTIFELEGIEPGEAVGAIPVESVESSMPVMCTLYYTVTQDFVSLSPLEKKVLLVDRAVSDKELNQYF